MKLKYIIISLSIILLITLVICIILKVNKKDDSNIVENTEVMSAQNEVETKKQSKSKENVMVIGMEKEEEQEQEPPKKDAAQLTQEIYNINGPIGNLNIPKTRSKYGNL